MMTSILLVDVQGLETRVGNGLSPSDLLTELSHTMHGMNRQIMVQRAYCSGRISTYRRNAYRDAGYQIVETAGPDETLIMMTLDLASLAAGNAVYEEVILLGGTVDYTALARLAHENLMMISVMDHPTIPTSLETLADGLIDPEELPVSDAPSILDRADSKRDETDRKSPFLTTPPKGSILTPSAKAETEESQTEPSGKSDEAETGSEPEAKAEPALTNGAGDATPSVSEDADEKKKDANGGDPWPDPKTGPILVAGGSIADAVGLAAMDDPETKQDEDETSAQDSTPETEDTLASDIMDDVNAELSVSAEDIGKDEDETPATVSIDLQIEDLVAEEFTDTSSEPEASEPQATASDDSTDEDDPLDALFADLGSDLAPDTAEAAPDTQPANPLDSLDINPDELLEGLDPVEPSADITASADAETPADESKPADEAKTSSSKDLSEEVDELLSRLMAEGPSDAPAEEQKLDVVPER
eukprot:g17679.t1